MVMRHAGSRQNQLTGQIWGRVIGSGNTCHLSDHGSMSSELSGSYWNYWFDIMLPIYVLAPMLSTLLHILIAKKINLFVKYIISLHSGFWFSDFTEEWNSQSCTLVSNAYSFWCLSIQVLYFGRCICTDVLRSHYLFHTTFQNRVLH